MRDVQVRPAIFAPAPLRRHKVKRDPAQWRSLAVFAAGAAIGAVLTYACSGARVHGAAPAVGADDKTPP